MRGRLASVLLIVASAAGAQTSSGLAGHDSNAPIDVSSDSATLASKDGKALLTGNVHAVQGDMTISSDRATVSYSNQNGSQQIHRLDASGGVTLKSPTETASSSFAIYDLDKRILTMIGGVVLNKNGNVVRSQRLVYDLNSGKANVDSGGRGGRVTGHFTVPQRQATPPATPPAKIP